MFQIAAQAQCLANRSVTNMAHQLNARVESAQHGDGDGLHLFFSDVLRCRPYCIPEKVLTAVTEHCFDRSTRGPVTEHVPSRNEASSGQCLTKLDRQER